MFYTCCSIERPDILSLQLCVRNRDRGGAWGCLRVLGEVFFVTFGVVSLGCLVLVCVKSFDYKVLGICRYGS